MSLAKFWQWMAAGVRGSCMEGGDYDRSAIQLNSAAHWRGHYADPSDTALSPQVQFMLDALEKTRNEWRLSGNLVHHSDCGSRYITIRNIERSAEVGIEPSIGSVKDSSDCECVIAA